MSKSDLDEIAELQKLGADLSIKVQGVKIRKPNLKIGYWDYNRYGFQKETEIPADVSMAWVFRDIPAFLDLYLSFGYDISGPQTSQGDFLIHSHFYGVANLQYYLMKGLALDALNPKGQNIYFYNNSDEIWDFLKAQNVPLLTEDKDGNSLLAYAVHDLCKTKTLEKIKEIIAKGANPHLVSKTYNLNLVQVILANVGSTDEIACAKSLVTALKNYKFDFNTQWNMQLKDGNVVPGFGTLRLFLESVKSNSFGDLELKDSARAAIIDLIKYLVSLGYKPEVEEKFLSGMKWKSELLENAYQIHFIELVGYLKSAGFKEIPFRYEDGKLYTPPANACEIFPNSKTYKPFEQGCLSSTTGLIWSTSQKVTSNDENDHYKYCKSLRGEWEVPSLDRLMREHFTRAAKPGMFGYQGSRHNFFDISKGLVNAPASQNFYYICVKPAYYKQK